MLSVVLIKLASENRAENIFLMNSQVVESFFRQLRSLSGTESMMVNWTMKGFISKVHRVQIDEKLMNEFKEFYIVPKIIAREKRQHKSKEYLSTIQLENIVKTAVDFATQKALQLGMVCTSRDLTPFLK